MNLYTNKARRDATMAAARTLIRLKVDSSQPIDIFKIIQDEGIWLMFQPLKSLFGVYLREGNTSGIILNAKHPLSLQRFTAAHEFGHHILKHTMSLDDEAYIERAQTNTNLYEIAADAFAAHFLMPLQLINTMLIRMGLQRDPEQLTPLQVYQLALDLGVSYTAVVNHLATLGKITQEVAADFRKQKPKDIKKQLAGRPLESSWADIWVLDKENVGKVIHPRVYDELSISLPETPSTGYVWMFENNIVDDVKDGEGRNEVYASNVLQPSVSDHEKDNTMATLPLALISNKFEANDIATGQTRYGDGGNRYLSLRTMMPGQYTLRLSKRRPWQSEASPIDVFEVYLDVSPKPTGDSENGLSVQQQLLMSGT